MKYNNNGRRTIHVGDHIWVTNPKITGNGTVTSIERETCTINCGGNDYPNIKSQEIKFENKAN